MNNLTVAGSDRRPRVVFIISTLVVGGHEHQAYHLIHDLTLAADVTVICPSEQVKEFFQDLPCAVVVANFQKEGKFWQQLLHVPHAAKILRQYVAGANKVIVSGGAVVATLCPVYACKRLNRRLKCIAYVPAYTDRSITHGVVGVIYNIIIDRLARRPDAYCTINKIQAAIFRKRFNSKVIVLPNKIRPVALPVDSFGKRLVYVGRFDEESKDLSNLVLMLDHPENPYRQLLMIGSGPAEESLRRLAANSHHVDVSFLPWLNSQEMDRAIGLDDCLIMNSRWEGEPLVVREFIARGLPTIAKNIAGVRFIVRRRFRFDSKEQLFEILHRVFSIDQAVTKFVPPRFRASRENALQKLLG